MFTKVRDVSVLLHGYIFASRQRVGVAAVSAWVWPDYPAAFPRSPQVPNTQCCYTEDTPRPGHTLFAPPLGGRGRERESVVVEAD